MSEAPKDPQLKDHGLWQVYWVTVSVTIIVLFTWLVTSLGSPSYYGALLSLYENAIGRPYGSAQEDPLGYMMGTLSVWLIAIPLICYWPGKRGCRVAMRVCRWICFLRILDLHNDLDRHFVVQAWIGYAVAMGVLNLATWFASEKGFVTRKQVVLVATEFFATIAITAFCETVDRLSLIPFGVFIQFFFVNWLKKKGLKIHPL